MKDIRSFRGEKKKWEVYGVFSILNYSNSHYFNGWCTLSYYIFPLNFRQFNFRPQWLQWVISGGWQQNWVCLPFLFHPTWHRFLLTHAIGTDLSVKATFCIQRIISQGTCVVQFFFWWLWQDFTLKIPHGFSSSSLKVLKVSVFINLLLKNRFFLYVHGKEDSLKEKNTFVVTLERKRRKCTKGLQGKDGQNLPNGLNISVLKYHALSPAACASPSKVAVLCMGELQYRKFVPTRRMKTRTSDIFMWRSATIPYFEKETRFTFLGKKNMCIGKFYIRSFRKDRPRKMQLAEIPKKKGTN